MAYTNIDDPSAHFQAALYTATGSNLSITNDGNSDLQPDFIWFKRRDSTTSHAWFNSSVGRGGFLISDTDASEFAVAAGYELLTFDSDGFSLGLNQWGVTNSSGNRVAWQWKANGGTTSSNTDGNITSTVQSNQDAGFSIVTYTGNGSNNQTIGHGLGVQPSWWIVKRRDSTGDWWFGASSILGGTSNYLKLNSEAANAEINNIWGDSPTSSTLFRVSNNAGLNASGGTYVAYLFANKQGYSKFGSYVGNGSTDGPFVYTGFKPAFIMRKRIDGAGGWEILDYQRNPTNLADQFLSASANSAESNYLDIFSIDILSNGFKFRTTRYESNQSGSTYIYMAFAENPFVTSTGIPTTAR
jgi:hypothetical protein